MNDKELAEIKARAEAATPGPWEFDRKNIGYASYKPHYGIITPPVRGDDFLSINVECGMEPEADFIAHARTDIPALLAEVERLTKFEDLVDDEILPFCARLGMLHDNGDALELYQKIKALKGEDGEA